MALNDRERRAYQNMMKDVVGKVGPELATEMLVKIIDAYPEERRKVVLSYPPTYEVYTRYKEEQERKKLDLPDG